MPKTFVNPIELSGDQSITKADMDTPFLAVDLDKMESNISQVVAGIKKFNVQWRPHCKGHKSPDVARKLTAAGAIGSTCAKLAEAEALARGGVTDLLIANLIVGDKKLKRLAALCEIANPVVCIDHIDQAVPMSAAMVEAGVQVRVIIEINIGLNRVGCGAQQTKTLAQQLSELPGLKFSGIMGYEGHLLTIADPFEKKTKIEAALKILSDVAADLTEINLPCQIVSCGGTGSYMLSRMQPNITELQAGGAIFMDQFYHQQCGVEHLEKALTVYATVVGRPTEDRAIIDAGKKTMHVEYEMAVVVGRNDIQVESLSAEHGTLKLSGNACELPIGTRLEFVPGYADMTCVLHDYFYAFRGDNLEAIWELEARGILQ